MILLLWPPKTKGSLNESLVTYCDFPKEKTRKKKKLNQNQKEDFTVQMTAAQICRKQIFRKSNIRGGAYVHA